MQNKRKSLGIVCESFGFNQIGYTTLINVKKFLLKGQYPDLDISLFYNKHEPLCSAAPCGIFNVCDSVNFDGKIIFTDYKNLINSKYIKKENKIFYVQDLEYLRYGASCTKEEFNKLLQDKDLTKIYRNSAFCPQDYVTEKDSIMKDIDIDTLMEKFYA